MPAAVGTELEVIATWLAGTLLADAALAAMLGDPAGVYDELAPLEAVEPFVVFAHQSGVDERVVRTGPDSRLMTSAAYIVKAVALSETFGALAPIVSRVDTLLNGAGPVPVAGGGTILGVYRESHVRYIEPPDNAGRQWRHRGGLYRIFAQTTD